MKICFSLILSFFLFLFGVNGQCSIDSVYIKSMLIDPTGTSNDFDTNNDGFIDSADEYIEICNLAVETIVDVSFWQIGDDDSAAFPDFTLPANVQLGPGECLLIVNDYCPDSDSTGVCDTPQGILSMNLPGVALLGNNGDVVTMTDSTGNSACSIVYGNIACDEVDPLDVPPFDINNCESWGNDLDGCPLLFAGDSCDYLPVALPIELISFTARINGENVYLEWLTASELNNDFFEIEWKGAQNHFFETFEIIDGSGTTHTPKHYHTYHISAIHGLNYYRIKQVDFNGKYSYSPIRVVNYVKHTIPVIAPNVIKEGFRILGGDHDYSIFVFNVEGQLIIRFDNIQEGQFIELNNLIPGVYVARIEYDGHTTNHRILKI